MSVSAPSRHENDTRNRMVIDRVTLHYQTKSGPLHALDNVSRDVRDGEFLCIIGPSGCGKTTLDGERITKPNSKIAMICQDANLVGSIFGVLTTIGAETVGGAEGYMRYLKDGWFEK